METYTIAEAAELTGLTKKAVRNRVDRGQLRSVLRDGMRRIPRSELDRAGLTDEAALRHEAPEAASVASDTTTVIRELVDRLERQASEIAQLRVLTVQAESLDQERDRLEQALFAATARISELEQHRRQPRRFWPRRAAA